MTPSYDLNPAKKRGINSGSSLRSLRSVNHAVINKIKFATDEATFKRAVGLYESGKVTEVEALGGYYSAVVLAVGDLL